MFEITLDRTIAERDGNVPEAHYKVGRSDHKGIHLGEDGIDVVVAHAVKIYSEHCCERTERLRHSVVVGELGSKNDCRAIDLLTIERHKDANDCHDEGDDNHQFPFMIEFVYGADKIEFHIFQNLLNLSNLYRMIFTIRAAMVASEEPIAIHVLALVV